MHTVTKILVVFAAVLAILLAALTMAYSVNASRIVADYRSAKDETAQTKASAQAQVAEAGLARAEKEKQVNELQNRITEVEGQLRALQTDNGRLMAEKRAVEGDRDAVRAQISLFGAANETLANLNKSYRDEVTHLRENELAYKRKEIELGDRINDLDSQLEVSQANTRSLQEQLVEARRSLEAGGGVRTGDTATGTGEPYAPAFAVSGKVTSIAKDVNGKYTARINLGRNNQLKEGMKLSIVRNGDFIGDLVIVRTDLQESIGEIDYLGRKTEAKVNDEVRSLASR